jgi:TolA-binding protein
MFVTTLAAAAQVAQAASVASSAPSAAVLPPAVKQAPTLAAAPPSWAELARAGKYAEAYELARASFDDECRADAADRVLLLGETARLSGHGAEARRAYTGLRERFAGSAEAAQAAFALGRLALDTSSDRVAAQHWFETYLLERPSGPLASAALGRLLELHVQAGDSDGAATLAREYLKRYPSGPRATAARQVLEAGHVDRQR